MADPAVLLALADRCEREEPSRELDLAISVAVDYRSAFQPFYPGESYRWGAGGDEIEFLSKTGKRIGVLDPQQFVLRWTSSLDAAVTLVPEHISYELTFSAVPDGGLRRARLWDWRRSATAFDPGNEWSGHAKTLPLALVAASLRARAALGSKP